MSTKVVIFNCTDSEETRRVLVTDSVPRVGDWVEGQATHVDPSNGTVTRNPFREVFRIDWSADLKSATVFVQ